jgi:hypothetical protein
MQKQTKTILKTGDGVIGDEELYVDAAGFVTCVINPWRGATNPSKYIGWMQFTVTYTFSGLRRPGAALSKRSAETTSAMPQAKDWEHIESEATQRGNDSQISLRKS